MIALLVALLGFVALCFVLPIIEPGRKSLILALIGTAEFRGFEVLFIGILRKWSDRVAVDDRGLWYLPHKRLPNLLRWEEIANVEARDIARRLIVGDAPGVRRIKLEYQLENFDKLRDIVLERAAARRAQGSARSVFNRN